MFGRRCVESACMTKHQLNKPRKKPKRKKKKNWAILFEQPKTKSKKNQK